MNLGVLMIRLWPRGENGRTMNLAKEKVRATLEVGTIAMLL